MTILFDSTLVESVANGVAPTTGGNGGPFSSVTTTNGTVVASTTQAWSGLNSIQYLWTSNGGGLFAVTPAATPNASYKTIYHNFDIFLDTLNSTATVISLVFVTARIAVYLFNSTGWKIGFASLDNGTSTFAGTPAVPTFGVVSAAMTTAAWHHVTAVYTTVDATHAIFTLSVDGVVVTSGSIAPTNYTKISGATQWRIGSSATFGNLSAAANSGDKIYMDNTNIVDFLAPAPIAQEILGSLRSLSNLALSLNL